MRNSDLIIKVVVQALSNNALQEGSLFILRETNTQSGEEPDKSVSYRHWVDGNINNLSLIQGNNSFYPKCLSNRLKLYLNTVHEYHGLIRTYGFHIQKYHTVSH